MKLKMMAVLLATMLCTACAPKHIDVPTTAEAETVQTTTAVQETDKAEQTTSPAETTAAAAPSPSITDVRVKLDEAGTLWEIQNERINAGQQQNLQFFGKNLLLTGNDAGEDGDPVYKMTVLSGADGSVLAEAGLKDMGLAEAQICGETIAVTDLMSGTVVMLDSELKEIRRFSTGTEFSTMYVDPTGQYVYVFLAQEGLKKISMTDGGEAVLAEGADLYPAVRNVDTVTFTYVDRESQKSMHTMVNLGSGQVANLPFAGSFFTSECDHGLWLAGKMNDDGVYYIGSAEPRIFTAPQENAILSLLSGPSRILCKGFDEKDAPAMSLYGTDGSFLSGCTLPLEGAFLMQDPLWMEEAGGYLFPVTDAQGMDHLIFWDLSVPVQGKSVALSAVEGEAAASGSAVSQALYERAAAIGDKYGLTIRIADQSGTDFGDHAAAQISDEALITEGLDRVERVLSGYPEGFMQQLLCGNMERIELHLTGAIRRTDQAADDTGFTGFVGCAQIEETYASIAVDIAQSGSPENTLHHEIMHVINHRLEFDAHIREGALYSEDGWNALNPEGFAYTERLTDLPENFYDGDWAAWFVDDYSRTYGKEDRARIMEYAMTGDTFIFKGSPGRLEKLDWLCQVIRDCFDTTGWPEKTLWEETLEKSRQ